MRTPRLHAAAPSRRTLILAASLLAAPGLARAKPPADPDQASASAGPAGPNAADIIAGERAAAAREGKGLLLDFHASWCSWCTIMDRLLDDDAVRGVIAARYRILKVRALEHREDQRAKQWRGVDAVFAAYASDSAGLPFLVFLNPQGDVAATSISTINGENFGFPVLDIELDGFDAMMARAIPDLSPADRALLRAACVRLAPRQY